MKRIKEIWGTARLRWKKAMPNFFKKMMTVFALVGGTAITVHIAFSELGIQPHEWWEELERYIVGISVGGCFVCKFTVERGNVDIPHITNYDKEDSK